MNHYKCYRAKITPGAARFPSGVQASIVDSFNTTAKVFDVRKPRYLCNPVSLDGEPVPDPTARLVCYTIKGASGQAKHVRRGVFLNNTHFGVQSGTTIKESELCVPATVVP